jgi:hypothetical protein
MSVKGPRARAVVEYLLSALQDQMPAGVSVRITRASNRSISLTPYRASDRHIGPFAVTEEDSDGRPVSLSSGAVVIGGIGTWIPLLPRSVRLRLAAQDAVETILSIALADKDSLFSNVDLNVRADLSEDGIEVSYVLPGGQGGDGRRSVTIPTALFERR